MVSSMKFPLQWIRIFCAAHTKQRTAGVNGRVGSMMDIGRCAADEQQRIAVVQLPHLVRGQQLLATMSSDEFKTDTPGHKARRG